MPPLAASRADGVARAASEVVGGPAGVHLAPSGAGRWGAAALLPLAAALPVAAALWTRAHCLRTGWASPDQFVHACYSDVPALVGSGGASGQPPTTAVLLRLLDAATATPRGAFELAVVLSGAALALAVALLVRARPRSPWDAALVALSPTVVTAGLVSVDLAGVALLSGALLAWARSRPLLAGALIGLAAGVRPQVALVLVAAWLVALVALVRAPGPEPGGVVDADDGHEDGDDESGPRGPVTPTAAGAATAGALAAAVLVTLLARVGTPTQPAGSRWLDLPGGAGYGALWLLPGLPGRALSGAPLPWGPLPAAAVTGLALGGLVVVLLLGAAAAARTARASADGTPGLAAVGLVLVAGALAVSPAVPVQATLAVLPLAALAAPRWRDHLPWALAEAAYATGTWLYLYATQSHDGRGLSSWAYALLLVVRLAALGLLAVQGVRAAGRPAPLLADGIGGARGGARRAVGAGR